jgi:hypothetical protein
MRPATVSKKSGIFWPRAPRHGQPRRRRNSAALAIPGPTAVQCMLIVGLVVLDWGCEAFQPFLKPFSERFSSILTRFSLFRAAGNLPKAPHVPSDGVREALSMHLGRPRPSAQTTCVWGGHMHFHFLTAFP